MHIHAALVVIVQERWEQLSYTRPTIGSYQVLPWILPGHPCSRLGSVDLVCQIWQTEALRIWPERQRRADRSVILLSGKAGNSSAEPSAVGRGRWRLHHEARWEGGWMFPDRQSWGEGFLTSSVGWSIAVT